MVFDVDKLKEALRNSEAIMVSARHLLGDARVIVNAARMMVAGQPLWWCVTHGSKPTGPTGEVCEQAINLAYRTGTIPFDRTDCRMVEGWWMPTGGGE